MYECNYVVRDGQFNPDRTIVNDTGAFATLSTAVFYNVLAWRITGEDAYAETAAGFIDTWFLNNATYMNPNLEYSQVVRGPNGSKTGTHLGLLDLHCFTKIASAIQVMRDAKATAWTSTRDSAMVSWTQQYLTWLLTNPLSLDEKASTNNHGTFWFAQAASVQVLVGNLTGATETLHEYFDGIYQNQINATGDQPLEAVRTLPFHYRAYNMGGILCINRIADYLGWNAWNITTAAGKTVQDAANFAMTLTNAENNDPSELFPNVAAVASYYGDPNGQYAAYLTQHNPVYPGEAWFFWDQPLSNSGINVTLDSTGTILISNGTNGNSTTTTGGSSKSAAASNSQPSVELALATLGALGVTLWFAL
ncbi:hypothetical protein FRB98_008866 [Tulasnella sp. 332]|nr:hypothetical protein FRB98_008866 [Tulasnella sp. 332]